MRKRLDQVLAEKQLASSRSRARDAIQRGFVQVAGRRVEKAGYLVDPTAEITVCDGAGLAHVSRGALKLKAALEAFNLDPKNRVALDMGASTGGFTEVLINQGAKKVFSIDVGHGQLYPNIGNDARVVAMEGLDARTLSQEIISAPISVIVADVSFISLTKALPAALALTEPGAWLVGLIKPQFEVAPTGVGKDGVVRDSALRQRAEKDVCDWLAGRPGWQVIGTTQSPIAGGSGNIEILVGAVRDE